MTRWLAISNRANSEIMIKKQIWGVPSRNINQIRKTRLDDTLLVYVGQQVVDRETTLQPAITGCFKIVSGIYEDSSRVFTAPPKLGDEIFPIRIRLKPIKVFDPPVEFKPLIPKLKFITNKSKWAGHIRGQAMREIPDEDYHLIIQTAKQREYQS